MIKTNKQIRRQSESILEKTWEKIVRSTIKTLLFFDSNNKKGVIYDSFWSMSPAGNWHLIVIADRIPNKPLFKGGMNFNILFSIIMKKYENDSGLITHEMTHADQGYRDGFFSHFYDIAFVPQRRYELEIEGYSVSVAYGMTPEQAANLLLTPGYYNLESLGLTKEKIIKDLT